ncbi:MAG: hypothetical protein KatS3mg077_2240 [Candidatus Binatia bacterium]|nr:MAG: hypothetical protein KatS3mg077_2240 [Candidatus Binatia bacterium]
MDQRVWAFLAGVFTVVLLAALLWLGGWLPASQPAQLPQRTPTAAAATATPSPTRVTASEAPRGYRLAGVAENAGVLYAVVEQPDGRHGLYRQGEEVPGLGKVVRVGGEEAVFDTSGGELTLWVAPAATPTRTPTTPKPTATPRARSVRSPTGSASTPGSTVSTVPDRPAF